MSDRLWALAPLSPVKLFAGSRWPRIGLLRGSVASPWET